MEYEVIVGRRSFIDCMVLVEAPSNKTSSPSRNGLISLQ